MKEENKVPEIVNDAFYVKQEQGGQSLKFAYLHLAEKADETFLAVFKSTKEESPLVYWWNDDDVETKRESRHVIISFIGEAYMSLYITCKLIKPMDKPLWEHARIADSIIPISWPETVKNINREQYGSRK